MKNFPNLNSIIFGIPRPKNGQSGTGGGVAGGGYGGGGTSAW